MGQRSFSDSFNSAWIFRTNTNGRWGFQFERFQWEIWIRLEAEVRMKKSSPAAINPNTLAPLCRKLYNKYKKQNKLPEAKMEIPKSGTTTP